MYIVREIFNLRFGHYREAKALIDEAASKKMFPETPHTRMLSDFTGKSYRLVFESGYKTLDDFEKSLTAEMNAGNWSEWYHRFKQHIESSHREILKII